MREIEARMVELLAERGVSKDGVISHDDVLAVQKQMGEPRDFSDDDEAVETDDEPERSERRLMRDTEHALIGGVCAGIAAYWGTNPLWVRLLFIFSPFITFGAAVLIYIVMWLSVPDANVLSTTNWGPSSSSATAAISVIANAGLEGVSNHTSFVSGVIAAAMASVEVVSTTV